MVTSEFLHIEAGNERTNEGGQGQGFLRNNRRRHQQHRKTVDGISCEVTYIRDSNGRLVRK